MPKARRVLAAVLKFGWEEVHLKGSHHKLKRGSVTKSFSWHDNDDLGPGALRITAKDFDISLEELKKKI
jgi:predicted RNA binding protein YcfA (HicA-like mRNA interferase family)